jgi:hypothetical protein
VSFPISCAPAVQEQFDRGVALLHSFAYTAAENAFQGVSELDPRCAMAHWGVAMAYFNQLWDPPIVPSTIPIAQKEVQRVQQIGAGSERERQFINALALIYQNAATVPYHTRAANYEQAMSDLASENSKDVEGHVFYALALLANTSPADRTHAKQKQAADLLEPLDRASRNTRESRTTSFMLTTMRNWHQKASRRRRPIPRLHLQRPMRCTCHRIYSRDSAYGKTPSLRTLRQGKRHTSRATREKSCTPWIIWYMPICRVDATKTRLESLATEKHAEFERRRFQDSVRLYGDADSLRG